MWKNLLHADPVEWLLQGEPWVKYNTLREFLGKKEDDQEVKDAKKAMVAYPLVKLLVNELQDWPSYPLKRHNDAKHPLHKLTVLADIGFKADDPGMRDILEKVLSYQSCAGAFQIDMLIPTHFGGSGQPEKMWMACDAPVTLYSLLQMGLRNEKVQKAVTHLQSLVTDKGVLCKGARPTFRGPGKKDDPCPYATLLATKTLTHIPEMKNEALKGAEMLLWHWEHQKERKLYLFGIGTDFRKLKYPFVWYDILHVVDVLSTIDSLRSDERLKEMIDVIVSKQDNGQFTPESVWMAFKQWDFGQKKTPSLWMTFLVARILKRMYR
ncbi:MAG: hypothetical protein AYK19_17870 [Theionarchaea archaeon DG-70-1]|nr:MAG: hypothetical protein AYK19_17870 [Theionarchaea archaeon DG-70-1]